VNSIKVILLNHEDHFLYKFIDKDESLHFIIDFDLSILNTIFSKFLDTQVKNLLYHTFRDVCLKIFLK